MNDPYVAGARVLRHALDTGAIDRPQYDDMYAALAAAAEKDAISCAVEGCQRAAYIGDRCAHHVDRNKVRQMVRERYRV